MPAVASYGLTGNAYIDGVLGGYKWATTSFTFSFPTSGSYYGSSYGSGENVTNFGAFNTAQQAVTRDALKMYASVANLSFAEVGETSTQHADLRFALSDKPGTAWAYFPSTSAEGGDAWFNKSGGSYAQPVKGNYAYMTFVHEIGHALGLEHPHESGMPADRDSVEYTVMSYRSYTGASTTSGYVNETWGYAQSPMMYDIAALQHMYGANYATNSSDTVYSWSPTSGEMFLNGVGQGAPGGNKILRTVWDGGGNDTYDFSNYASNLKVDLRPGEWTTTAATQLVKLHWDGSKVAVGNIANALQYNGDTRSLIENAVGGSGNDTITGNDAANSLKGGAGNDRLFGGTGNDALDGGIGDDTAVFSGARAYYSISKLSDGSVQVADLRSGTPDGSDVVWGAEWFQFVDKIYTLAELETNAVTATATPIEPVPQNLSLNGTNSGNSLYGQGGDDKLYGRGGNDKLYGSAGNDLLVGGTEKDVLFGGAGADVFDFNSRKDSLKTARDTIKDFVRGVDHIDLSTIDANSLVSGNQAFSFIGSKAFSGHAGQLKFSSGVLSGDINGDKMSDFEINVSGVSALAKGDFYL
ncbi:M10 family metallopeptidase [Microvirga calopogonii]|uniref:M10 family metallopeptidase n=1 Tax=Microvirga calopogonii TaxID=2078013 RepID=UPI000E0CF08D|nr:M10 family metallopeptidase [Microvirga calopogonii]